jgi:RimJ/RimL family protein N-acetyltransferase
MPELMTQRLMLRELGELDWPAVHEYASDPEVVRYMLWGPNTAAESLGFVQRAMEYRCEQPRMVYDLAVIIKAQGRLIGGCGIQVLDNSDDREGEIGYCFNRRYWGHGYATEAARALVEFGFSELGLHRISATCDPENVPSARVLEKIGMQREGHLREHKWQRGRWRDSLLYAILEHEWRRLKAAGAGGALGRAHGQGGGPS